MNKIGHFGTYSILILSILFITNTFCSPCFAQWPGKPVLLEVYGASDAHTAFYTKALADAGVSCDLWDIAASGPLPAEKAAQYGRGALIRVINPRFQAESGISTDEIGVIMDYLSIGGSLLLVGRDLGAAYDSPLTEYLQVAVPERDVAPSALHGVNRDFITNGMTLEIGGQDSSGAMNGCDAIEPSGNAEPILYYDAARTKTAAIKLQTCTFRACYMAFGLEGITGAEKRAELVYRALDWLQGNTMMVGVAAPGFMMKTLDGADVSFHGEGNACAPGKIWALEFFATWCSHCSDFRPKLARVHEKYKDRMEIFAVSYRENPEVIKKYIAEHPEVSWKVYYDDTGRGMQKYGVKGIPAIFLINPASREVAFIGANESEEALSSEIEKIIASESRRTGFEKLERGR